ncbi:hypothetical protein ACVMIX_003576 [Rhizobium leguminosarum]
MFNQYRIHAVMVAVGLVVVIVYHTGRWLAGH